MTVEETPEQEPEKTLGDHYFPDADSDPFNSAKDEDWKLERTEELETEEEEDEEETPDDEGDDDTPAEVPLGDDPAIPDVILRAAQEAGFTPDDVKSLGLGRMEELLIQRHKAEMAARQPQEPTQDKAPVEAPQAEGGIQFEEFKLDNPDDYDETTVNLVKHFNTQLKTIAEQVNGVIPVKTKFQEMERARQEQVERATHDWLENQFATLQDEYGDHLGRGKIHEIPTTQLQKRAQIAQDTLVFKERFPGLSDEEAFMKSVRLNLADVTQEKQREQAMEGVKRQSTKRLGTSVGNRSQKRPDIDSLPPKHPDRIAHYKRLWAESGA